MPLNEADFIVCEFAAKQPTGKTHLRWGKPAEVFVQVQLPGRGAQTAALRARKWVGESPAAEALQKKLALLGDQGSGTLHDFVLYLRRGGKKVATLLWSAKDETKTLAELRALLGQVGHLAFSEALAYFDEGTQLGRSKVYGRATQLLTGGLKALADGYRSPDLRDDTGSYLVLAEHLDKSGKPDQAFATYSRVLRSRLDAYRQLHGLTGQ